MVGSFIFSFLGSASFPGTWERSLSSAAPRCGAAAGCGPGPAAGGVSLADQSWLPVRAHSRPEIPAGRTAWDARGMSPRHHLRRLLSLCRGLLRSGCHAEGREKWGFGAGLRRESADGGLYLGPKTRIVSASRASSAGARSLPLCPAASRTERNGFLQCECNYPAGV